MEGKTVCDILSTIATQLISPVKNLLVILGTLVFIYGVVEFIAGASSEDARTKGKKHMIWGIAGLVIIMGAMAMITILQNFFGLKLDNFCVWQS